MANVQPENGFTRIAHEILEQTMKIKLSPTQYKIVLAVWRYTYGFSRKSHEMSLTFLSGLTGVHKQQIKNELDKLIERQIINVIGEHTNRKSRKLSFNKNYDDWDSVGVSKITDSKKTRVSKIVDSRVSESTDSRVSEITYQDINNLKKNIKKDDDRLHNQNPFKEYEKFFGNLPSNVINEFNYWIDESQFVDPEEIICEVIKRAKKQTPRNPVKYISKILNDIHNVELFTIEAVKAHNEKFDQKVKSQSKQKVGDIDWENL
ncbi:replication protein [Sutcliffiella horikoshii]|uniref:replication protein n=1 Tax=Sutcliffiella horikoshii TaxID=79883 RepID=UPI003CE9B862